LQNREKLRLYALDELFDSELYSRLAVREKNDANRRLLEELARVERAHYEFWSELLGERLELGVKERVRLAILVAAAHLLGKTFTIKLLERRESSTIEEYERAASALEGERLKRLRDIIEEEKRHELEFANRLDETIVRQLGSVALGISDAIVELTGVLLGFVGYTQSSIQAAVGGFIVGVSAALSMAAAAYAQAKHEVGRNPALHAAYTGVFYMLTVLLLLTPLLLGLPLAAAIPASIATAVALLALLSFYSCVVLERMFLREFFESASVVMAVALVSYSIGAAARGLTGIAP